MRKVYIFLLLIIFPVFEGFSQVKVERSIDEKINDTIAPLTKFVSDIVFYSIPFNEQVDIPLILVWLFFGALFCTFYLRFINITGFCKSINVLRGKYSDARQPGEVTHFQALATAVSGTVGLGNIAGVAIAISLGGPGATFWMIIAGFFAMSLKFVECTLSVKYRKISKSGKVSGGPMYFLKEGLSLKGWRKTGSFLGGLFAFLCFIASFGGGNMFQANQAVTQVLSLPFLQETFVEDRSWLVGCVLAILVAITIIGGIKSIAGVTSKLVPAMCIIYLVAVIMVIFTNITQLPDAIYKIFSGAFSSEALYGGMFGAMIQGIRRAMFSNEAGIGSAAIAHSAVKTNEPVTEGYVSLLEPVIDTVIICTMTAIVIVITDAYQISSANGIELTSMAFASVISWFPYVLSVIVVLFAFSTMISWSYYGLKSWTYLFGETKASELIYKFLFCLLIVIGSSLPLNNVINFSDAMNFAMSLPNIIGLYILIPVVKAEINSFNQKIESAKLASMKKPARNKSTIEI